MELLSLVSGKMSHADVDLTDYQGRTALHAAANIGACASTIHLVKMGADIDKRDKNGNTPIALAIKNQHQSATILLTQLGADLCVPVIYVPVMSVASPTEAKFWTAKKGGLQILKERKK